MQQEWLANSWSEIVALGVYILLIAFFIKAAMKVRKS